jgi:hypothetical protein
MMPASSKAGGVYFAMPDVCLTPAPPAPPVPIPYPNIAQVAASNGASTKVLIENKETVVIGSKVPNSSGDEAGVSGGVTSGVNMNQVEPKLGSSKVYAEGKQVVFLTSMAAANGVSANMPAGAQIAPSQMKVFVMP